MIRVIKPGIIPTYKAKCTECTCEFEFDKKEIRSEYTDFSRKTLVKLVYCPQCQHKIYSPYWIKESKIQDNY